MGEHKNIITWRQLAQLVGVLIICGFAIVAGQKLADRAIPDPASEPLRVVYSVEW